MRFLGFSMRSKLSNFIRRVIIRRTFIRSFHMTLASASTTIASAKKEKPIRLGVIGVGRGQSFMNSASEALGLKLVAICDTWEEKLKEVGQKHNVATYTDFDKMLEHDIDAVVLANYFHQHAPFAIKALKAGKHVMSETASCDTLAEGVELCRTVEQTGLVYMLAENYPYTIFNQELRRIYRSGELGYAIYGEGEYNHPISPDSPYWRRLAPTLNHWRNWLPATYYCTHALAPLMYMTDSMPVSVNALAIPWRDDDKDSRWLRRSDAASVTLCKMDDDSVFKLFGISCPGHSCWYRLHGSQGAAEVERGPGYFGTQRVRVWHEEWQVPPGGVIDRTYSPNWPDHAELANKSGHGGGDFWTNFHFARAIRGIEPAYLDVYRGVAMSVVGAQSWRSALNNGTPFPIPDFKREESRKAYENDHWSPFPDKPGEKAPPSVKGLNEPRPEIVEQYMAKVEADRAGSTAAAKH